MITSQREPLTMPAEPDLDLLPLLRLAAAVQDGSPAQQVLVNLARTSQYRETASAGQDLELLAQTTPPETVIVAARPMTVPACGT
jgi:hypothetical protein